MIVHRSGDISRATDFILRRQNAGSGEEKSSRWRCAEREGKGPVGTDGYTRGNWGAWIVVGSACIELLYLHIKLQMLDQKNDMDFVRGMDCIVRWEVKRKVRETHFAKVHALYTFTTQCGTDRRRWRCLACTDYQFDNLILL